MCINTLKKEKLVCCCCTRGKGGVGFCNSCIIHTYEDVCLPQQHIIHRVKRNRRTGKTPRPLRICPPLTSFDLDRLQGTRKAPERGNRHPSPSPWGRVIQTQARPSFQRLSVPPRAAERAPGRRSFQAVATQMECNESTSEAKRYELLHETMLGQSKTTSAPNSAIEKDGKWHSAAR